MTTKLPLTTWNIVAGPIFRKTTLSSMKIYRIVSVSLCGLATIQIETILRNTRKVNDAEQGTMTWPGREGEVTPVFVYTNYPSAELFINGKSQGKRTKDLSVELDSSYTEAAQKSFERQKRYRLMWMDTKYEPGTLKVVAYDKDGNAVAEEEVHTAGKPHHIELTADRDRLKADGKDLSFINVRVVDKNGNLCPDATHKVKFNVRGSGSYRAAANGDPSSLESFQAPQMSLFKGQLTAVVQTEETPGVIVFEASASGVKSAKIELISE